MDNTWTPLHLENYRIQLAHNRKKPPNFPEFKRLELNDKEFIEHYVGQFPPYSDFNFVSLWSYNVKEEAEISVIYDNLIVKYHDYITGEPFYTFLGVNEVIKTISVLLSKCRDEGIKPELKLVPAIVIDKLSKLNHGFHIVEDHDSHDYVFSLLEHSQLKGKKYQDQRNLVNVFRRNINYKSVILDLSDKDIQLALEKFFNQWGEMRNKRDDEIWHEITALRRLFASVHQLKIHSIGLYLADTLVAFSVYQQLCQEYAILHFEKSDLRIKGSTAFLRKETARVLYELGYKHINLEQDLGIIGLRRSKKMWNPTHYLKKYKVY